MTSEETTVLRERDTEMACLFLAQVDLSACMSDSATPAAIPIPAVIRVWSHHMLSCTLPGDAHHPHAASPIDVVMQQKKSTSQWHLLYVEYNPYNI